VTVSCESGSDYHTESILAEIARAGGTEIVLLIPVSGNQTERRIKLMQTVKYKNKFSFFLALVLLLLTIAPSGLASPLQRWHHRHHRHNYNHHSKTKGAIVGGVGGAAVGALAGGGKGAIIGGALGAGTGALVQHYRNHNRRHHYRYR
jgi:ABC-type phosphate transport system permease subunit